MCGGQRKTCDSWFSLSTIWALGIELRMCPQKPLSPEPSLQLLVLSFCPCPQPRDNPQILLSLSPALPFSFLGQVVMYPRSASNSLVAKDDFDLPISTSQVRGVQVCAATPSSCGAGEQSPGFVC